MGHRGYASQFPENTLQSFQAAYYAGVDFVELDIQISSDSSLMVFHDAMLSRVTDISTRPEFATRKKTRQY